MLLAARTANGVLPFGMGETKLRVAMGTAFIDVGCVSMLPILCASQAKLFPEFFERQILRASLDYVPGEEAEDCVSEQSKVQKGAENAVPEDADDGNCQGGPDANVIYGIRAVSAHEKARKTLTERGSVSKHMTKSP